MNQLGGTILRCSDKAKTADFYAKLGLSIKENEHGGPKHFELAPNSKDMVFELYNSSSRYTKDALIVEVDSIESALLKIEEFSALPKTEVLKNDEVRFVYITDPDGRDVMLFQKL